ncbi:MAG TPA: hypothetical protein G4O13_07670 [Dehalococcoidia bacterium]|nr:hypothetical protein [Dehalococcoidia bacterium]
MANHIAIEPLLTPEAEMGRALARQFVENEVFPVRQRIDDDKDHTEVVNPLLKKLLIDLGVQSMLAAGDPTLGTMINGMGFLEELSRGDTAIVVAMGALGWCLQPIQNEPYKRPDLIQEFAPIFQVNEIRHGCFAMTEPEGGCDIENPRMQGRTIRTRAVLEGDEWVINGAKQWPSNAGVASLYCTVCTTDPELGDEGIALIYVPYPIEGMSFSRFENKAGMQADRNCTIYYDNVRVPKRYRAWGPGDDANLLHQIIVQASIGSAMMSVGCSRNIFEIVTEYATNRIVAGKPIKEHSVNACALADMAIGIETARTYTMNVAYRYDHPETYGPRWSPEMRARARIAKVHAADVSVMVANKAMEMMASFGYTREGDVEKHWRDSKMIQLWLGGAQGGRLDIARYFCNLKIL